jgi:hypothetical protein
VRLHNRIGFLALSGFGVALFALGCSDYVEKDYRTLAEARQAGMVEKGWVPSVTPESTTAIHFEGDLYAGSVFGRFSLNDTGEIRNRCAAVEGSLRVPGDRLRWLDRRLRDARSAADLERAGYEVFRCPDRMTVAIRGAERTAVYWSMGN